MFAFLGAGLLAGQGLLTPIHAANLDRFPLQPAPQPAGLLLQKGDRLAICGDSITEQKMYSRLIEDYLTACAPELKVTVRQYGWGGERAEGFLRRMTNDCLRFKPTVATTCYGMNDHEYRPYEERIGAEYRKYSAAVVAAFRAHGVRVVLGSPGCVGERNWWSGATTEALNLNLCELRNLDIGIANEQRVNFADVFAPMLAASLAGQEKYGTNFTIAGSDAIHPNWAGHGIMAYAFLKGLGFDGNLADYRVDLQANRCRVSAGHKLVSGKKPGEFEIRSTRYPFCVGAPVGLAAEWFPTLGFDPLDKSDSLRAGLAFIPFHEELNRFMLTVTNTSAAQLRVTWGRESKVFTREQLAQGVNLAVEFPLNPFSARFAQIDAAVAAKQGFETRQVKALFRPANDKATMAEIAAQTEAVLADTERQHAAFENVIKTAYAPVTHTLKITEL